MVLDSHDLKIPLLGRLSVHVTLHAPNRRKYDIDGRLKSLLDALEDAGVYPDDEAVDHLVVRRGDIIKGGQTIVQIIELPPKEQTCDTQEGTT